MSKKQKRMLVRIALSSVLLVTAVLLPTIPLPFALPLLGVGQVTEQGGVSWALAEWVVFLLPYLVIGWDILWKAVRNIARGQVFDENFLMALATVGAFATGEYPEAVFVMLFYQVGELFQSYAVGRSRRSISQLMDIRPDYANVERSGGLEQVDPEDVAVGDTIVVKPGERIPLDGVVLEGTSTVNTSALTGESLPRETVPGSEVISGCVNLTGMLRVEVTKEFEESTVSKILELVENAGSKKAKAENFITKFARYYTPAVVAAAVAVAVLTPLLTTVGWVEGIQRALTFLVISCPCALVISVPLSFFGGIGGAARQGILVKGGNYMEVLARSKVVVFDKTGTLTKGVFRVTAVHPQGCTEERLLELAALAESYSDHPISRSLKEACATPYDPSRVDQVEELSGRGVRARVDGAVVCVGNDRLMGELDLVPAKVEEIGTTVHVALDGVYLGYLVISDQVKEDAKAAITALKEVGVDRTVLLTGDAKAVGEDVAARLGLDEVHTQLLPGDKVDRVEELLAEKRSGGTLAFVGDGINDAPVLSRADVGIAMGSLGSDAAIEAADVVLMDDKPSKIALAIRIARKTLAIVKQNIIFAIGVKLLVLLLVTVGQATMWMGVFADVGVMVLSVLNAMRALKLGPANTEG